MRFRRRPEYFMAIRLIVFAMLITPIVAHSGAFVFSGETYGLDIITHPSGYTGTGGVLDVEVCIDSAAEDAVAMEISVKNIVQQINNMTATSPNLFFGGNNNIPSGLVDFESLTLHELGHCTGLSHPNLGVRPDGGGVSGDNTNLTQSGDGTNGSFAFDYGTDAVPGSNDDQRDDDQNLHWFEKGVNNPFLEVATPQASNYSRDVADLPGGHDFPANAARNVGAQLGFSNTEAVMQQGQGTDEDQRSLQADDVSTFRMGMTGLDEIASTADDYTINMVYGGIKVDTSSCDIVIESDTNGFGSCSIGGSFINSNHLRITSATYTYNSDLTWFFNDVEVPGPGCGADDLTFSNVTHNDSQDHEACESITYGPNYVVGASGNVTATAPSVTLGPGTTISGVFTVITPAP
ncbi:MAG: hypothetical protein ACI9H8_000955 [Lysobacterales bacterium]|jgi:hypothetical protein